MKWKIFSILLAGFLCFASFGCQNLKNDGDEPETTGKSGNIFREWGTGQDKSSDAIYGSGIDPRARDIEKRLGYR